MLSVKCKLNFWTSFTIICLLKDVKPSDQSGIQIIESNPGRQLCSHQVSVPVTCRPLRAARCSVSLTCRGSTTPLTQSLAFICATRFCELVMSPPIGPTPYTASSCCLSYPFLSLITMMMMMMIIIIIVKVFM